MKILGKILKVILSLLLVVVLIVGGYLIYVTCQYSRIEDNVILSVHDGDSTIEVDDDTFTIMTYNIGFGAYSTDFSFFMDSGVMNDGKKVSGTGSKAKNAETVLKNTQGAISTALEENPDFLFMQEVDLRSDRARNINQLKMITEAMSDCNYVYAKNFHSAYLFYPFNDPHGKTTSGILTCSKYKIDSSVRRSFPVDNSFPTKFFDLDRCFSVSRIKLDGVREGKELVLINVHLSAYDKGGKIRARQLALLNNVLAYERSLGNYIVVGGDFNHDIASKYAAQEGKDSLTYFESQQEIPDWVFRITDDDIAEGYTLVASLNAATCRSTDLPYKKGVNYSVVIDGFMVSDNIIVNYCKNIDTGFEFSDHNPATMSFTLA